MRERKPLTQKTYYYATTSDQDVTSWTEVLVPNNFDEYDVAEEIAQKLWDNGDTETQNEFELGTTIKVREKGSENITTFKVEVDYEPQFYVKPVTS